MNPNPFMSLLHSRKFWLLILDTSISLILFFVGKYAPGAAEDIKFLIIALQPVFVTLIGAIAYEDASLNSACIIAPPDNE
jgi:hypothetical protein